MRIIAFSDIHGNIYALDAFLRQLENEQYDCLVFCGDIFGYYYNQNEVIEVLQKLDNLIWLRGNHDTYFLNIFTGKELESEYVVKYGHSYESVKNKYKNVFSEVKEKREACELDIDGVRIGMFHGTPDNPCEGRLYPNNEITDATIFNEYNIVILGHTHYKMKRFCGNTMIVNPGSLGQPRDGKGYGYAVIDTDTNEVEFRNVFFDSTHLYHQICLFDKDLAKLKEVLEREPK